MKEIFWSRVFKSASCGRVSNSAKVLTSLALSKLLKRSIVWGAPFILTVEPTVLCNLKCPHCVTGMGKTIREKSSLDLKTFRHILDIVGESLWYLLLYNQGEPFLNSDFLTFVELAKQKQIYVTTSTNGHFLQNEDFVCNLVRSGLDSLIISLDGADAETYEKYRSGGDFRKVVEGIELLVKIRNELKSSTPKVLIQFLVMKHNEHQFEKMRDLARSLGADRLLFKTFQIESKQTGEAFLPSSPRWRRYKNVGEGIQPKNELKGCDRLWYSSVVLSDGRIVPCCFDKNGIFNFGNISQVKKFEKIWKSNEYTEFRNRLLSRAEQISICQNCSQNQTIYL